MRIELQGVRSVDASGRGFRRLSGEVRPGTFLLVLGPPGAGKTRLLGLLAGLACPDVGEVLFDGEDGPPPPGTVSWLFDRLPWPEATVRRHVNRLLRRIRRDEKAGGRARSLIDYLQLRPLMDECVADLSAEAAARLALLTTLAPSPRIIVADEPFIGLAPPDRLYLLEVLRQWQETHRMTVVLATCHAADAVFAADEIAVLHAGQVHQWGGCREVYGYPASLFAARFAGSIPMGLVWGRREEQGFLDETGRLSLAIPLPWGERRPLVMGARPEDVLLDEPDVPAVYSARAHRVERRGLFDLLHLRLGRSYLTARMPPGREVAMDKAVRFGLRVEKLHWFDPADGRRLAGEV
jgi:ABC-type sugar transport system ATPase subunit